MKRVKVFVAVVVGVGAFLIMVTLAEVMMEKRKKKSEKKIGKEGSFISLPQDGALAEFQIHVFP
jgi:hypothetical protein